MEFDLDSGGLAQKVQELRYEINAARIRVAFQAVERFFFFLKISRTGSDVYPTSCAMGTSTVILGTISRRVRITIPFNARS